MNEFGQYALFSAWLLSVIGFGAAFIAGKKDALAWLRTARNATILSGAMVTAAIFALGYQFINSDFSNQYVWQFSNRAMESGYRVSAIWGGMDGSMLLWAFILAISSAIVAFRTFSYPRRLIAWTLVVINSSLIFFLSVVVFLTNPFRYIKASFIPPDGNGLNPLLQNPYMAIHPPMLYLGFTTVAIPFAFCMGALLSGQLTNEWIRLTRRWTITAWCFLTAGIALGGHWAYLELGWGGFWAWDPVENASFMPWLTMSAFVHSVMVQERKDMLKFWNIWLIVLTYALTVFGTFLTRSGVVQSVHAFAETDIGWVFLLYLGLIFTLAQALTWYRRKELSSPRRIESFLSREAAFLINNLLFLSICFAVLWGVMFPVLSEALTGQKQTTGIPFFNAVNVPLFLALIFMMGIGPLIAWRKASLSSLRRTFLGPLVVAFFAGLALIWAGVPGFYPVLSYSLCFFVFLTIIGEVYRAYRAQRSALEGEQSGTVGQMTRLVRRHSTRFGGFIVHLGVLFATISITASMAHKTEKEFTLGRGESTSVGRFTFTLNDVSQGKTENYDSLFAKVTAKVTASGAFVANLDPELRFYNKNQETTTEVALRIGAREDVYLVLAGVDETGQRASLKLFINPLQVWLWIGVLVMIFGGVVVILPSRMPSRVPVRAKSEPTFERSV
jgi:cytochrome c-type biogenesis protein CcmF